MGLGKILIPQFKLGRVIVKNKNVIYTEGDW